jgi:hypothetical protein
LCVLCVITVYTVYTVSIVCIVWSVCIVSWVYSVYCMYCLSCVYYICVLYGLCALYVLYVLYVLYIIWLYVLYVFVKLQHIFILWTPGHPPTELFLKEQCQIRRGLSWLQRNSSSSKAPHLAHVRAMATCGWQCEWEWVACLRWWTFSEKQGLWLQLKLWFTQRPDMHFWISSLKLLQLAVNLHPRIHHSRWLVHFKTHRQLTWHVSAPSGRLWTEAHRLCLCSPLRFQGESHSVFQVLVLENQIRIPYLKTCQDIIYKLNRQKKQPALDLHLVRGTKLTCGRSFGRP